MSLATIPVTIYHYSYVSFVLSKDIEISFEIKWEDRGECKCGAVERGCNSGGGS